MIHLENLRHFITIYKPVQERNSVGQLKESLMKYQDFWAAKYNWQNRNQYEGKNLIESDVAVFTIYYDANISNFDVIDFESKKYIIKGIKEIGFREGLEITAQYKSN